MNLGKVRKFGLSSDLDFRAKATFGVASAALILLFPIAVMNFFQGQVLTGIGSMGIVIMLTISVWRVYRGQSHQSLILYGLTIPGMLFMTTVFQYDGIIGSLWCFPSIVATYCMLSERRAWAANLIILSISLPMAAISLPPTHSLRVATTLISVSIFSAILVRVIDQLNLKLQQQLVHDPLTGLLNRITVKEKLEYSIERHDSDGICSALLAIDVDHFKSINDRHGHDAGDKALLKLSEIFRNNLREGDFAFRTGGEEFIVLLCGSDKQDAYHVAERMRREVEVADIVDAEAVTISIGAATHAREENWTQWVKRADNSLYEAKHLGRNRIAISREHSTKSISDRAIRTADPLSADTGTVS